MPLLTGKLPWMGKLFQKLEIDLNLTLTAFLDFPWEMTIPLVAMVVALVLLIQEAVF